MELTIISTFAGCGGSSLGYKWAGFKELLAIDFEQNAVDSFKANFPEVPVWKRDVREVDAVEILDFCKIDRGDLSVFDGSPPCQGFSTAGKRKVGDKRNELSFEFMRLIDGLQPKVFVMENVEGMAQGRMIGRFKEIIISLKSLNYQVKCKQMNSKHYGVPQSRERAIFIGVRDDLNIQPSYPVPSPNIISLKDVLPVIEGYRTGSFDQTLHPSNRPVCTIIKTAGLMFIRDGDPIKPTIDEVKKLCSFPGDFKLTGPYIQQWARLGNAVMPKFMWAIAENIKDNILGKSTTSLPVEKLPAPMAFTKAKVSIGTKIKQNFWKPSLTSQFKICPVPYHLDTYRGCVYNCQYCFARDLTTFARRNSEHKSFAYLIGNRPDLLDTWIQRTLKAEYDYSKGAEVAFKERIPIKIGATADPFPPNEKELHITRDVLKVLHKYDYPVEIQTKNPAGLLEFASDFINPNWTIAVSLISTDEDFLHLCEPGAPSAQQRLSAIKKLTDLGLSVMVKIQPAIYPKVIEDMVDLVQGINDAGCWAFNLEGLKIRKTMPEAERNLYSKISDYLHFDVLSFYRKEQNTSSDWELLNTKKHVYVAYAQMLADKHNLKLFVADNNMGNVGCSSECCGTQQLRDYKILGCNTRTQSFPTINHTSERLEKVLVNFCRSKKYADMTIGEVCDVENNAIKQSA